MAKAKQTYTYPTKKVEVNGKERHMMICSNSKPEFSKYGDWAPEEGACNEWVFTNEDVTAVLCSKCVQRSLTQFRSTIVKAD